MTAEKKGTFGIVSVAMVTPFKPSGELDLDGVCAVADKLVSEGCDCVLTSGTTGESPTTHQPEKDTLVKEVRRVIGADKFLLAGAGSNDTAHAVRMGQAAEKQGADGLLVVSPYYNKPTQEGLYRHVRAIHDATSLPIMLYDIPGRTAVAFADETLERLAELPRVLAVKDATGDIEQGRRRMENTGLEYYSGDDGLNLAWLEAGARGVVSVVGHLLSGLYRDMAQAVAEGDSVLAQRLHQQAAPVVEAVMGGGQGATTVKSALQLLGVIDSDHPRLPLVSLSDTERQELAQALQNCGFSCK